MISDGIYYIPIGAPWGLELTVKADSEFNIFEWSITGGIEVHLTSGYEFLNCKYFVSKVSDQEGTINLYLPPESTSENRFISGGSGSPLSFGGRISIVLTKDSDTITVLDAQQCKFQLTVKYPESGSIRQDIIGHYIGDSSYRPYSGTSGTSGYSGGVYRGRTFCMYHELDEKLKPQEQFSGFSGILNASVDNKSEYICWNGFVGYGRLRKGPDTMEEYQWYYSGYLMRSGYSGVGSYSSGSSGISGIGSSGIIGYSGVSGLPDYTSIKPTVCALPLSNTTAMLFSISDTSRLKDTNSVYHSGISGYSGYPTLDSLPWYDAFISNGITVYPIAQGHMTITTQ